jgi:hypothetical protein
MNLTSIMLLFIAFQVKHFIADYPLQTEYMLGKFKDEGWVKPLLAHVAVHALGTFVITCWFGIANAIYFSLFDSCIHFIMDRVKADRKLLGRFKPLTAAIYLTATEKERRDNKYYYWSLGFDQLIHHLTGIVIIWLMASS